MEGMGTEGDGVVEEEVDSGEVVEDFVGALEGEVDMVDAGNTSGGLMHYLAHVRKEFCMDGKY